MLLAHILKVTQILCPSEFQQILTALIFLFYSKGLKLDLMILSVFSNLNDSMKY